MPFVPTGTPGGPYCRQLFCGGLFGALPVQIVRLVPKERPDRVTSCPSAQPLEGQLTPRLQTFDLDPPRAGRRRLVFFGILSLCPLLHSRTDDRFPSGWFPNPGSWVRARLARSVGSGCQDDHPKLPNLPKPKSLVGTTGSRVFGEQNRSPHALLFSHLKRPDDDPTSIATPA